LSFNKGYTDLIGWVRRAAVACQGTDQEFVEQGCSVRHIQGRSAVGVFEDA
jgi:hypothetical protein